MTIADLVHAILLLVDLCVGIAVGAGIGHSLTGAALGAVAGFLVGHLIGISLTTADLVSACDWPLVVWEALSDMDNRTYGFEGHANQTDDRGPDATRRKRLFPQGCWFAESLDRSSIIGVSSGSNRSKSTTSPSTIRSI